MPTTYTDQFFDMDPANPPGRGTTLTVQNYNLVDNNDDGDIDRFNTDTVDGVDVTASYPGDTVTIRLPDGSFVTYTGITFYLADGRQVFTPTDGQVLYSGRLWDATFVTTQGPLDVGDLGPVCFTPGTLIETEHGLRRIETLKAGDKVLTRDNGFQALRWIGKESALAKGAFAPVVFAPGVLGNDAELLVSQQHRILITGWRAELFIGEDEVLVAAKHLLNNRDVSLREGGRVTYIHLLFDQHEIVKAGGVWSESFFPGYVSTQDDSALVAELRSLFPDLPKAVGAAKVARIVAKQNFGRCLSA